MAKGKEASALHSRTTSRTIAALACAALVLIVGSAMGSQKPNRVITWGGNSADWNQVLHLGGLRLGCSDSPASCLSYADEISKSQGVDKVFLAILLDPRKTPSYASDYSMLSRSHPVLYEVGFDDFVSQSERTKLPPSTLAELLNDVAHKLKGANPQLRLGITLYDDELSSSRFPLTNLDEQFRRSVDLVHLYPHYRKQAQPFSASVQQARQAFPMAAIAAGLYAYDRRDYLPCAKGDSTPCSNEEELRLFQDSLQERLAMLGSSNVEWIEFYPGDFGTEAHWDRWRQDPRSCRRDRIQECIQNTVAMREVVRQALNR